MPVLQQSIAFLRRHPLLAFLLMGAFFLLSGTISINLYVVLMANIDLVRMYGAQAIEERRFAEDLRSVYQNLGSRLQIRTRDTELTGLLAMVAAILIVAGSALSVLWFGRIA